MKLDRNTNRGGRGKYALVNMRKLLPILDASQGTQEDTDMIEAFQLLVRQRIITLGNETPGDQFFVMKHKDRFTPAGLRGYIAAIYHQVRITPSPSVKASLLEYADQLEQDLAAAELVATRIPD